MSPITTQLAVLALASAAAAVPYAGGHAKHHRHFFHGSAVSGSGAPYGLANSTGIWGTGTGVSSGFASATGLATGISGPSSAGVETASSEAAPAETSTCTDSVVSVTHTNRITVTVPYSGSASSSVAAAVSETSLSAYSKVDVPSSSAASSSASVSLNLDLANKGYHNHRKSSTAAVSSAAAETTSSTSVYVAPTSTSSSSSAIIEVSAYVAVSSASSVASSSAKASSSATSSSAAATSTSASSGSGKRGVAYNDASLTTCFEDSSEISWGYNWGSSSSGLSSNFNYVPLLWGTSSTFTDAWSDAADDAISNGATHLMSFNEPDMSSQSNLSPEDAAAAYKTYMMPYAGKAKLGSPAVTNGGGSMGLNWLSAFIDACDDCQIDFVTIHWYDSAANSDYFKEQVQNATDVSGGKPVWVTEFGCTSGSDSDISSFLQEVMPWMDGQDFVERYSYFMVADGFLNTGSELSTIGSTYATYTSS